jgi:hypothetical protein
MWSFSSWQSEGSVRLLEVRQRIAAQVDELELRIGSPRGAVEYRPRDLLAVAVVAGASENDSDPEHFSGRLSSGCDRQSISPLDIVDAVGEQPEALI